MSLSQKNLASIQKAGQALHDASEAIAAAVRSQAEGMVANLASNPFSNESEQVVARFKTLAQLSQGLSEVELELQKLYAVASDLASPASDVIVVRAVRQKALANGAAVDVVAKPAKAEKVKKARKLKPGRKPALLTANDNTLLTYLQGVLKDGTKAITGLQMAATSGLPLGSVGLSLKKLTQLGTVIRVGRGTYRLGAKAPATATAPAAVPTEKAVKSSPAKKRGSAKASKPVKATATEETTPAKPKRAKKVTAKAAPAKPTRKVKGPAAKKVNAQEVQAALATVESATAVEGAAPPV